MAPSTCVASSADSSSDSSTVSTATPGVSMGATPWISFTLTSSSVGSVSSTVSSNERKRGGKRKELKGEARSS